jgi:hypothetical protein
MKKRFTFFLFVMLFLSGNAQSFEVWNGVGLKYKVNKKIQLSGSFNMRAGVSHISTLFPELTAKYKITKWANLSLDYRRVSKREDNGNYLGSNRLNVNMKFRKNSDRWGYNVRFRYQMSSANGVNTNYESDFDEAFRIKPHVSYDIKKSIFSPFLSAEMFYNPSTGILGKRIDKMRYTLGTDLELDGPHAVGLFIRIDQKLYSINVYKTIIGINYQLDLKSVLSNYSKKGQL